MRVLVDIICIFLLVSIPDCILEATGLYRSIELLKDKYEETTII